MKLVDLSTMVSPSVLKPKLTPSVLLRYIFKSSEEQEKV